MCITGEHMQITIIESNFTVALGLCFERVTSGCVESGQLFIMQPWRKRMIGLWI